MAEHGRSGQRIILTDGKSNGAGQAGIDSFQMLVRLNLRSMIAKVNGPAVSSA